MAIRLAASPERLTSYTVEKTAREAIPGFFSYVILWSILMAAGGALAGSSFGLALCYGVTAYLSGTMPLQSELDMYVRFFAGAFFGLFFAMSLRRQIGQWEGMITEFEEQTYQPKEMASQQIIRPLSQPQQRQTSTQAMRPGTYPRLQIDAAELYKQLEANGWRFVRDVINIKSAYGGNVFPNITANYDGILAEWQRMGWVDERQIVTDDGRFWLQQNSILEG